MPLKEEIEFGGTSFFLNTYLGCKQTSTKTYSGTTTFPGGGGRVGE